jgi:hypothetical protein
MKRLGSMVVATAIGVGVAGGSSADAQDAPRKLVAPVRGVAQVELTAPDTKVIGNNVVTTIRVKNVSTGPIAGLRVEENWFDRSRQAVPGDVYRHPRPLPVGEVIEIKLTTPRKPGMGDNRYNFSHANGEIKTKVVPKLDVPKPKPTK